MTDNIYNMTDNIYIYNMTDNIYIYNMTYNMNNNCIIRIIIV